MPKVRPIDANALYNDLLESAKRVRKWGEEQQNDESKICAEQAQVTFIDCALRVKNAPTVGTEHSVERIFKPIRYGQWWPYPFKAGHWRCDQCYHLSDRTSSFCPECGAFMREVNSNENDTKR